MRARDAGSRSVECRARGARCRGSDRWALLPRPSPRSRLAGRRLAGARHPPGASRRAQDPARRRHQRWSAVPPRSGDARALRSAHLATIYAFGFVDREPYFAMELIEGRSLFELWMVHVQAQRAMPVARTVDIIAAAARGLSVAHAQGIVHRDVKPENIMIEDDTGRVVLVDFGVALDSHGPNDGMIYGTPEYMAPELLGGAPASANTDQYGLALVAYELLTGALPFHEDPPFRQIPRRGKELIATTFVGATRARTPRRRALAAFLDLARGAVPDLRGVRQRAGQALSEAPLEPAATDGGLRVLVVDDDPLFVRLVTRCLHVALAGVPITIRRVTEPHAALEKCRTHLPELVVLDYEMPGMDGVEPLARVRALPRGETVRAIVLSGNNDEQTRLRFAMLGVRTFAAKPIDFSALVETLHLVARANGWIAAGAS
ncbi:MAG: response regulator [Myxococcales bacterium]|nr:response regulator [Myxococcales bacterium]